MLQLYGRASSSRAVGGNAPTVLRVTDLASTPAEEKGRTAFVLRNGQRAPDGFALYLIIGSADTTSLPQSAPFVVLPQQFSYLRSGDIVSIREDRGAVGVRVLYRRESSHNTFLVTERCDNYCLMCSQPPKREDDSWIIDEILQAVPLVDQTTTHLGFTGGEPTLLEERFLQVLQECKRRLPSTSIHVLSNGRSFSNRQFTKAWADIQHPALFVGIPLYSDVATLHDYIVQASGAYDQTLKGILNLKELVQKVEVRVVLHKQTYPRLPQLAEFIVRNLLFVDHVALMGLEVTGFTLANMEALWIDPIEYQRELYQAVQVLDAARVPVSIYNLPRCLLPQALWPFAARSISDWKNEYRPECQNCEEVSRCAGFFGTSKGKHSAHIRPIRSAAAHPA